jgi:hypothetical protein
MRLAMIAALVAAAGAGHAATVRIYSYDPANAETRRAAGALTFELRQQIVFTTLLRVRATEGPATAELKPAEDKALGRGGLDALIGQAARERDLYEVLPAEEGEAMIAALCPGSKHAWMAFGRLKPFRDLRVHVLGDGPQGAHLCRTLDFSFHGEWQAPATRTVDDRDIEQQRRFPY